MHRPRHVPVAVNTGSVVAAPHCIDRAPAAASSFRDIWGAPLLLLAFCQLIWQTLRSAGAHLSLLLLTHAKCRAAGLRDKAAAAAVLLSATTRLAAPTSSPGHATWSPSRSISLQSSAGSEGSAPPVRCTHSSSERSCSSLRKLSLALLRCSSAPAGPDPWQAYSSSSSTATTPASNSSSSTSGSASNHAWLRRQSCPGSTCSAPAQAPPLLPPQHPSHHGRLTIVLDLDETLIAPPRCAVGAGLPAAAAATTPTAAAAAAASAGAFGARGRGWAAVPRPGVHAFLSELSQVAEVVLWTAAGASYAGRHLKQLDPEGRFFAARVCGSVASGAERMPWGAGGGSGGGGASKRGGAKDLSRLGRDLARVVLVDNSLSAMARQPENGVPCPPYRGQEGDEVRRTQQADVG